MASLSSPMRLNAELVAAAERSAAVQKRSVPKQIEYWAELGKALERVIEPFDIHAIRQGLKKLKIETVQSAAVDPEEVFADIEHSRQTPTAADSVTGARIYYEASVRRPGLLDQVVSATGERITGQFVDGKFKAVQ